MSGDTKRVLEVNQIDNLQGSTQRVKQETTLNNLRGITQRVFVVGGGSTPVIDELNVTPSTSAQTITVPSGVDGYSPVNVSAVDSTIDANIVAGNIKKDVEILGVTGSYEGQTPTGTMYIISNGTYNVADKAIANVQVPTSAGKYQLLERVKDDSNNEIGTVCGFRKDSNNNEYAVVCLDEQYRPTTALSVFSAGGAVVTKHYNNLSAWNAIETSTENCDDILQAATTAGETSPAVSACRANSFIIDGTTYYGQLPSLPELFLVFIYRAEIDALDTSRVSGIPVTVSQFSSTFGVGSSVFSPQWGGSISTGANPTAAMYVLPVLELPNA